MFSLSRIPKAPSRPNNPKNSAVAVSAKPKKRARDGPPIPSFCDDELVRAEREFLEECERQKEEKKKKRRSKTGNTLAGLGRQTASKPSSDCPDGEEDDDSILEMEIFSRKSADNKKKTSEETSRQSDTKRTTPLETTCGHPQDVPNDTTKDGTSVPSEALATIQSLQAVSSSTKNQPQCNNDGLDAQIKLRIDEILAECDLNQVSFKQICGLLGDGVCRGKKHAIRAYVFEKIGILNSKAAMIKKPSESLTNEKEVAQPAKPQTDQATMLKRNAPSTRETLESSTVPGLKKNCVFDNPLTHFASNVEPVNEKSRPNQAHDSLKRPAHPLTADKACPEQKNTNSDDIEPVVKEKSKRAPRAKKTKAETKPSADNESAEPTAAPKTKVTKRKRAPTKRCCQLCTQCPCRLAKDADDVLTLNTSQSDLAVEKSLMKRLQKCEKNSERYIRQEEAVRRQLKSHRRDMWRKREELQKMARESRKEDPRQSRFLPDAEEIEENFATAAMGKVCSRSEASKARESVFGRKKKVYQPTLTQLVGRSLQASDTNEQEEEEAGTDEKTQDAQPALGEITEYTDDLPEGEPVPFERIEWIDGKPTSSDGSPVVSASSTLWSCALTGQPHSLFDRLFDDPASTENLGMNDLLNMLDDAENQEASTVESVCDTPGISVQDLSQRGREHAKRIMQQVKCDAAQLEAIRSVCPEWEENVCFALNQRDSKEIADALRAVQEQKDRLQRGKAALERLLNRHSSALTFFEQALKTSLDRLEVEAKLDSKEAFESGDEMGPLTQADEDNTHSSVGEDSMPDENEAQPDFVEGGPGLHPIADETNPSAQENLLKDLDTSPNISWGEGRPSIDSEASTLIPTASPRRSSILETCRSPSPRTRLVIQAPQLFGASPKM